MAKAINWPLALRDEILAEDCQTVFCAFRLGALYYEHQYWVPGEIVDIRVNHLRVRKAVIQSPVEQYRLDALPTETLTHMKAGIRDTNSLKRFLESTYNQAVHPDTQLSRVTYINLPVMPDDVET